jgi:putative redox protein
VQLLAMGLAGCMGIDLVHILSRGRHAVEGVTAHLEAQRSDADPKRFERVALHFTVGGAVPADAVDRALLMSRETYCSVWHSLRQDIAFTVTWTAA